MPKIQILFYALVLGFFPVVAQTTDWYKAKELMTKGNYALAQSYLAALDLTNLSDSQIEKSHFDRAVCAMELFNDDAVYYFEKYLHKYPHGSFANSAHLHLGNIYYRDKNYTRAVAMYIQLNPDLLSEQDRNMFFFRKGYACFTIKNFELAKLSFYELDGVSFKYEELTRYYVAHIAYVEGNYASALQHFNALRQVKGLGTIVRYYIAQIYYLQGRSLELLEFALPLLDSANTKRAPEIAKLIGDTYYRMDQFGKSIEYLERFQKSAPETVSRLDNYQLGFAYYKTKAIAQAIPLFEIVLKKQDSLAQYAAYHLADTYMQNDQKEYALNAFKHAATFAFNPELQEDAAFNYSKLVYEKESAYAQSIDVLQKFIQQFPNSAKLPVIQGYLVNAYSFSSNYKEALIAFENFEQLTFDQKAVYQRMAFFRGIELYNQDRKEQAIQLFDQSLQYPVSEEYKSLCFYWKGEAYHTLGMFKKAVQQFEKFLYNSGSFNLDEFANVYYSLAYAHYHLQKYSTAIKWFRKYIKNTSDSKKQNDACLRTADAYFMKNQYTRAADFYSQAETIAVFDVDYALYQQSLCFALLNEISKQKATLSQLISDYPTSPYVDDAKFALAGIYFLSNRLDEGVLLMQEVIDEHPFSPLVKLGLLKLGLHYYSADKVTLAINNFKRVIEEYPATVESQEALVGLKNIYIDAGDVKSYFDYIEGLSEVSVSVSAQDSITFEAAEILYVKQDHHKAIAAFEDYLQNFSTPIFKLSAHFYKAEALFALGSEECLKDYLEVLEFKQNQFTERSLAQAARIELNQLDFGIAALHYTSLQEQAQDKELKREATIALMRCYEGLNNQEQLLLAAQAVLSIDKITAELEVKARLIIADKAFQDSEYYLANKYYKWIVGATNSSAGAHAQYYLAYIFFLQDDFSSTEKYIFKLSEEFTDDYFIAKGFILLADVYLAQGNLFQATATLESIIENHEGQELKQIATNKKQLIIDLENEQNQEPVEPEIVIDLVEDMDIDFDDLMEAELSEGNEE